MKKSEYHADLEAEFDRQVANLLQLGYPDAAKLSPDEFRALLDPLRKRFRRFTVPAKRDRNVAFVIVVKGEVVPEAISIELLEGVTEQGISVVDAKDMALFKTLPSEELPEGSAYLLVDTDTGEEKLNLAANDAIKTIKRERRVPLTLSEGIALITHKPEVVKKNNGLSLLGSKTSDDRIITLSISGRKVKLGWDWAADAHPWLGAASGGNRLGAQ